MLMPYSKGGTTGKVSYLVSNKSDDDILIMGSSRAVHHYNPQIFEDSLNLSTYNIGIDGNGIILAYGLAQIGFKMHKPKLVIYELTPGFDLLENDNTQYLYYLKPYYNLPEIKDLYKIIDKREALKMNSSLYRLNSYTFQLLNSFSKSTIIPKGFLPHSESMNYEPKRPPHEITPIDSIKLKLLNSFMSELKKQNIDLIFTISPIYSYPSPEYKTIIDFIENENGTIINHLSDSAFMNNKKYFFDRTHMNKTGADTLSSVISHYLKGLSNY